MVLLGWLGEAGLGVRWLRRFGNRGGGGGSAIHPDILGRGSERRAVCVWGSGIVGCAESPK